LRHTTDAAVSSQVVSMPRTSIEDQRARFGGAGKAAPG
jgi:hypothetical protein